jgi:hypothetical protein
MQVNSQMLHENLQSEHWRKQFPTLLQPATVADAVVKQLLSGWGGQIILPGRMWQLPGARGWPSWLQEALRNMLADELKSLQPGSK